MFEPIEYYPFLAPFSAGWPDISEELNALDPAQFMGWPETDIYTGNWTVFPFYKFGEKVPLTCAICPRTTALIETVPGMVTAGFSRLAPDTHITPHVGYTNAVLRFHLGLTDAEDCGLRVADETRSWHPGSAFVFDDTREHEAWNRGPTERTILLLDFKCNTDAIVSAPEHLRNLSQE
jgi:ornithine lipid ester-linked acyl 2-hydroxylase